MKKTFFYIRNQYNHLKGTFRNYAFFALYLLSRPSLIRLYFRGIYLPQYLQYEWISKYQFNTFIDVGANDGNVSRVINYIFPKTTIFAFEPLEKKKEIIKSKIKSSKLIVETLALSDHIGDQIFYEYDFSAASSFLKPDPKIFNKSIHVIKSYSVKITTLDKYFNTKKINKPIFIKMDAEGTENFIISGGEKLLKQVSLIIIETSFIKYRKNQCLFDEIYKSLTKLGFSYKGSLPDSYYYPVFGPARMENSIFIQERKIPNYLQK